MPSQAATYARHRAEKAARKRARMAQNRRLNDERREATGAQKVNAAAGSRAARKARERVQAQRDEIALQRSLREARAQAQADVALRNQRQHDKDAQSMLTDLRDFQRDKAKDDAQQRINDARDEQQAAQDEAQKRIEPLVQQPPKEKGSLKGKKVGAIDETRFQAARDSVALANVYLADPIDKMTRMIAGEFGSNAYTYWPSILEAITAANAALSDADLELNSAVTVFRQRLTKS